MARPANHARQSKFQTRLLSRQHGMGSCDGFWRLALVGSKGHQQGLVAHHMVQNLAEEAGLGRRRTQIFRPKAGQRQKSVKTLGIRSQKAKGANGDTLGRFRVERRFS
jgi:hypothetical protein